MDTDSFIIHIETEDFYKDIAGDVEKWFDTSAYDKNDNRALPIGKNKKGIGLFKDELGRKVVTEFIALRAKAYAYITEDGSVHKRAKGTKKCIIKREIMFEHYKDCLFNSKTIIKSQQRFRSDHHRVYTEEVNKIALSSNDDKRLQTYDKVTTHPYGTNLFKVCEMRYVLLKKIILKHAKKKCIIKREPTFKYELQQTHESHESQQTHESQILKNEPEILRNVSQIHRNKSQQTHEPQIVRNELQLKKWLRLQKCFLMILHTENLYVQILKRNMYLKVQLH